MPRCDYAGRLLISDSELFRQKKDDCSLGVGKGPVNAGVRKKAPLRRCWKVSGTQAHAGFCQRIEHYL